MPWAWRPRQPVWPLWVGEHVGPLDRSRYPYAADGQIAVPADADWLDPMIELSFAAITATPHTPPNSGIALSAPEACPSSRGLTEDRTTLATGREESAIPKPEIANAPMKSAYEAVRAS